MKPFQSFTMVRQPRERVWSVMRDRLPEVAARLPDLDSIVTLERGETADGRLLLVNRWRAELRVPEVLQRALGADSVSWTDRALWDEAGQVCEWTITPSIWAEHIGCGGTTRYEAAMGGRGTRVTFAGQFELRRDALQALPALMGPALATFVENIVSAMIPRNLVQAVTCAADLINAEATPRQIAHPSRTP